MIQLLGLVLLSFIVTSFLLVPFIDWLFYLRRNYLSTHNEVKEIKFKVSATPITDKLMKKDFKTPVGGGLLIIPVVLILTVLTFVFLHRRINSEIYTIFLTMLTFGS
ncbi:hypothetical protein HY389_01535, partial [Candidatus Daviesbacteria bacterium]|nr:hypothetical protein [Candidatus Daviesbacteria bacterium]